MRLADTERKSAMARLTSGEELIVLGVEVPGRPHGRYGWDENRGELRLEQVIYPPEWYPADLCSVMDTLGEGGTPLSALLLGNLSHPSGCLIPARVLGLLEIQSQGSCENHLVAVAADDPHFAGMETFEALPEDRRQGLAMFLRLERGLDDAVVHWVGEEAALSELQRARQRHRLARSEQGEARHIEPAWKPAMQRPGASSMSPSGDSHTAAEHGFYALPQRFQRYVEEYLTVDERILHAIHRPALRSRLHRTLMARRRLEEGVFIVSDQQVTEVVELLPPDRAGIRYGFVARGGVPERLDRLEVRGLADDAVELAVTWRAMGGAEQVSWEFPVAQRAEVERAAEVLRAWLPRNADRRVRRATPPAAPDPLPLLRDPAANDPSEVEPLAERLQEALARRLFGQENVLARCLLPAWVENRGVASLLVVTSKRVLVVSDPVVPDGHASDLDVAIESIASLEFCSTLVLAYLKLFVPCGDVRQSRVYVIRFGRTLAAMNECYRMLRRVLAVSTSDLPVGDVGRQDERVARTAGPA